MATYHALLVGEDGTEFGITLVAKSFDDACDMLENDYPESNIVRLKLDGWENFKVGDDHEHGIDWKSMGYESEEDYLADNCLN